MSLSSLLGIARSALLMQRRAMSVTAHNVANAGTPGYSRQRLELIAADPLRTALGLEGRGVADGGISRIRDLFFDAAFRRDQGLLGSSTTMRNALGQVEAALDEPSNGSLGAALDGLFHSFADLANDPAGAANRSLVQQAGRRFVQLVRRFDERLQMAAQDAATQLRHQVGEVNRLAQRVADLNQKILAAGPGGAADLEDQRDLVLDQLSGYLSVRVLRRDNGAVAVLAGDTLLVDGGQAQQLEVRSLAGGGFGLASASGGGPIDPQSGSLSALVDLNSRSLPALRARLDEFVRALVSEVNALHRSGYNMKGFSGVDFFDPAGVTAATLSLSAAVAGDPDEIAAGGSPATGDGSIALRIAGLVDTRLASLGDRTMREFYADYASSIGIAVQQAEQDSATQQSLVDRAESLRSSVSGVSIDEEMVVLIAQQEAFAAAARLIQVANEMMDDLMRLV